MSLARALAHLESTESARLAELLELLRIPSVSTDPERKGDVRRAALWVKDACAKAGLAAELHETPGHPIVFAERKVGAGLPTVLVYGHYDVQPADEVRDGWSGPPFEPRLADGNVYARGATDDKGQMYCWIKAAEAWDKAGGPPVNLKLLIEGEEEIGSRNLDAYLRANKERLAASVVAVSDTDQYGPGLPAITVGLRGLLYTEIRVYGAATDVHSGQYGGAIPNPVAALCKIIAGLHDADGRVQIEGFYDDVRPLSAKERAAFAALPFDEAAYKKQLGLTELCGEKGYTTLERTWARPTLEPNGIFGGFMDRGAKTVLPSYAGAKVSMRLVPDQEPKKILEGLRRTVAKLAPKGVRVEVTGPGPGAMATGDERHHPKTAEPDGSRPVLVDAEGPYVAAASAALEKGFGKAPVLIRTGGSIPVVLAFKELLGIDTVLMGYGLPDDRAHGPNEKMCIADYHRGAKASASFLAEVAARGAKR